MDQWWPKSNIHLWQIVGKVVGEFSRVVGEKWKVATKVGMKFDGSWVKNGK